ncbi:hypothetical protein O4G98_01985 [Zoogloeaceae bacterium G21618-S1]|nr:hypothetical protein [Zoogloeaceae bacterium G21618-S1]
MFGQWMGKKPARLVAAGLAVSALIPWLPSSHAEPPRKPSTQVIYRFDDHRYLTMIGYGCEGAIHYVDEERDINTPMIDQFARVFLPKIIHADNDGDFIFIPYHEPSAFRVSKDHGKTFQDARWVGTRPYGREIKAITVVNQQAFIEVKDGRVFMTSKPFGKRWGLDVIDAKNYLPQTTLAEWPNFQNLPTTIPEVKDYKGWTQMRCDPDLEGEPKQTSGTRWNAFQLAVLDWLGRTVARPITWLVHVMA